MSAIFERLLLAALGVTMVIGLGAGGYGIYEHGKVAKAEAQVEAAQLETAQAKANAAAAASDAAATRAAFTAQSKQLGVAKQHQAASSTQLQAAVTANPSAAQTEVSPAIWDAIYGSPDAAK